MYLIHSTGLAVTTCLVAVCKLKISEHTWSYFKINLSRGTPGKELSMGQYFLVKFKILSDKHNRPEPSELFSE